MIDLSEDALQTSSVQPSATIQPQSSNALMQAHQSQIQRTVTVLNPAMLAAQQSDSAKSTIVRSALPASASITSDRVIEDLTQDGDDEILDLPKKLLKQEQLTLSQTTNSPDSAKKRRRNDDPEWK